MENNQSFQKRNPKFFNSTLSQYTIAQHETKPARFMVLKDDKVLAKGMTKAMAREVVASLILGRIHWEERSEILAEIEKRGM